MRPALPRAIESPTTQRAIVYGAILVLAAVLRYVGLSFSSSVPWGRPDEELFVVAGLRLFATDDPHTAEGGWPELWFRAHHLMQALLREWWALRHGESPGLACVFALAPGRLILPMRVVAATMSLATVALVMRLGWRAGLKMLGPSGAHAVAIASGLFYAVNVLAARDAHFAVSDQPLVFFMTWMLVATAEGVARGRAIDFLSCGIALGLAIATKWTGLAFGIVPVIGLGVCIRERGLRATFPGIALGLVGIAGAFLITNPTFADDPQRFLDGLRGQAIRFDPDAPRSFSIYPEAPTTSGIVRHPMVSFPFALGWPLTIVAASASILLATVWARRAGVIGFLCGAWTLFFVLAVTGRTTLYFARYSLPAHPTACVAAALLVAVASHAIARRWRPRAAPALLAAMLLALGIEPAYRALEQSLLLARPDTREQAVAWLRATAGEEPIALSGGYARPYFVEDHIADACEAQLPPDFEVDATPRLAGAPDFTPLVSRVETTWHPLAAELIGWSLIANPPRTDAEWALVAQPWLPCDQPVSRFAAREPPACYREVRRFEPRGIDCDAMWDDQDHFFAPLWGFRRPWSPGPAEPATIGPSIVIYRSECE